MENVVILGGGIAGLSAAIYSGRASLAPLVLAGPMPGGWISTTTTVENFPGFPDGVGGLELTERMRKQAEKFGARIKDATASKIERVDDHFVITYDDEKVEAKAVIFATGSSARRLGLESEKKYWAKGVSTCATCDAYFFQGKDVAVIGGGDSACEEALFISKFAKNVTIIHRRNKFRASKIMQHRVANCSKISTIWDSVVEEILGDGTKVTGLRLKNVKTKTVSQHKFDGVFLAIGHIPNTKLLEGMLKLGKMGYLKVNNRQMTKISGLFGAGDVADHAYRQAVTAAASGCMAAMEVRKYLKQE
ncbi:MAG: thioredoxin-disulfide reductase [Candidatus Woesearchaeota archaeon]